MPLNAMARDDVCPQQHAAALGEAIRLTCDVMRGKTKIKRGEADGDRAWGLIAATLGGLQHAPGPKTAALNMENQCKACAGDETIACKT